MNDIKSIIVKLIHHNRLIKCSDEYENTYRFEDERVCYTDYSYAFNYRPLAKRLKHENMETGQYIWNNNKGRPFETCKRLSINY